MVPSPVFAFHCQSCHYCLSYWRELLSLPSVRTSPALGGPGTCSKAKSMNKEKSNDLFSFIHNQPFHLVTTLGNKKKRNSQRKKFVLKKSILTKTIKPLTLWLHFGIAALYLPSSHGTRPGLFLLLYPSRAGNHLRHWGTSQFLTRCVSFLPDSYIFQWQTEASMVNVSVFVHIYLNILNLLKLYYL